MTSSVCDTCEFAIDDYCEKSYQKEFLKDQLPKGCPLLQTIHKNKIDRFVEENSSLPIAIILKVIFDSIKFFFKERISDKQYDMLTDILLDKKDDDPFIKACYFSDDSLFEYIASSDELLEQFKGLKEV